MVGCTFETKCWENDYKLMLTTNHVEKMIKNCNYNFESKQIIINNVKNEFTVCKLAQNLQNKGIIDRYFLSSEFAEEALKCFNVADKFEGGYNYSIAELVGIMKCETKYLLHFSSDSYISKEFSNSSWIIEAIDIMENNEDVVVANPTWNDVHYKTLIPFSHRYNWKEAESESFERLGNFYLGQGFSDQCYLINTDVFKKNIYNFKHQDSERYPKYGGELFEKKCDAYMRVNSKFRITSTSTGYVSKNINKIDYILEKFNLKLDL
jgi:hypothetical protein